MSQTITRTLRRSSRPFRSDPYGQVQAGVSEGLRQPGRSFRTDEKFFTWYNTEHYHSGIATLTPEIVHTGQAIEEITGRQAVLNRAHELHPERFVNHPPSHPALPEAVWINAPAKDQALAVEEAKLQ